MTIIETSIMSFLDLVGYLIISSKLLDYTFGSYKIKKILKIFAAMVLLSFVMGILSISPISNYSFIYGAGMFILLSYLLYKRNIRETLFTYLITTVILLIIQLILVFILSFLKIEDIFNFKVGLVVQFFILLISFLLRRYTKLNLLFNYIHKNNNFFRALMLNMFLVLFAFLIYRYLAIEHFLKHITIIAILSIGMLYINFVIIKNALKNEYEEKMLATYEKYLRVIDDLMEDIRAKQHEFDNHIQAIHMITLTSTDYESIISSMSRYIDDLEFDSDMRDLIKLDNKILAGFLYEKLKKAKKNSINFKITIEDYGFKTKLKDYELIEIVGNLIDNAFETRVKDNVVRLELKKEKDMDVIEVKNKHPHLDSVTLSKLFKPGFSTKSVEGHGYGLSNIKNIISNNGGELNIQNETIDEENYLVFKILII